jgi:uncharacterized protein with PIN domain
LGYDCAFDAGRSARDLIHWSDVEGRVFLTRNTRLGEDLPVPRRFVVLPMDDPVEQTRHVVRELDLDVRSRLFSRCIRCNVPLDTVADRESVRSKVPSDVFERFGTLYRCRECGTVFWQGSHVANTCRKLGIAPPA